MDAISKDILNDGDGAYVLDATNNLFSVYTLESSSSEVEDAVDFTVIKPDDEAATPGKRWIMVQNNSNGLEVFGTLVGTIVQADTSLRIGGAGVVADEILDENDLVSDSATALVSQQSVKAYVDAATNLSHPQRSNISYVDADTVTLDGALYDHSGTLDQLVSWSSPITFNFGSGGSNAGSTNLGNNEWHYIYIDDSALSGQTITAARLLNSTTAPTWSDSKRGWYNLNDRAIGFVRTNGVASILPFYQSDNFIQFDTEIASDINATDVDNIWTDCTMVAPNLGDNLKVLAIFDGAFSVSSGGTISWRKNGSSSVGFRITYIDSGMVRGINTLPVLLDATQKIEVVMENSSGSTMSVLTQGVYLPLGM